MVKITGGDEPFEDARGAGRNPNIGKSGRATGRGQGPLPKDLPKNMPRVPGTPDYMLKSDWLGKNLSRMDNNPERLIRAIDKDLKKLPKGDAAKLRRYIRTAAVKRGGAKQPPKRNRRKGDGGTPFIDSKNY